jgi:hypothetical protein
MKAFLSTLIRSFVSFPNSSHVVQYVPSMIVYFCWYISCHEGKALIKYLFSCSPWYIFRQETCAKSVKKTAEVVVFPVTLSDNKVWLYMCRRGEPGCGWDLPKPDLPPPLHCRPSQLQIQPSSRQVLTRQHIFSVKLFFRKGINRSFNPLHFRTLNLKKLFWAALKLFKGQDRIKGRPRQKT